MKTLIALLLIAFCSEKIFAQDMDINILYPASQTNCDFKECFKVQDVMDKAGRLSFETQEGLLDLFQARQTVKVRTGQLLPSFNLRIANPVEIFEYIPNLVGFLFPSNWFRQKESKLHAYAQIHSFASLVANQRSMAAGMYFTSHQEVSIRDVLNSHKKFTSTLISLMKDRYEQGEIALEDLEEVKAFHNKLSTELVLQKNYIKDINTEIIYLMADDSQFLEIGPLKVSLPDLRSETRINPEDFLEDSLKVSPELKTIDYLIEAARFSRKARAYDFLTPDSGTENAFGFGYFANLRIGQAEVEKLRIKKKAYALNIKRSLAKIASQMNSSIEVYELALATQESLKYILTSLMDDFRINSKIDINRFLMLAEENIANQQTILLAQHNFIQAKLQLERLLFETDDYKKIYENIPKIGTNDLDCYLRKENKQIMIAVQNGNLNVPDKIEFERSETKFCL